MTKGRLFTGLSLAIITALLAAAPALAGSPREIYNDYADNGKLDGNYSTADVQRAFRSAAVQGYGSPVVIIKKRTERPTKPNYESGKKPGAGVAGDKRRGGTMPVTPRRPTLPFTGAELGLFTVVGFALIGSGILLRLTGRKRSSS